MVPTRPGLTRILQPSIFCSQPSRKACWISLVHRLKEVRLSLTIRSSTQSQVMPHGEGRLPHEAMWAASTTNVLPFSHIQSAHGMAIVGHTKVAQ